MKAENQFLNISQEIRRKINLKIEKIKQDSRKENKCTVEIINQVKGIILEAINKMY